MDDAEELDARATALAEHYANEMGSENAWLAEQVVRLKAVHLDGDPCRWSTADLDEVLLELLPRKVVFEPDDEHLVVPTTISLLEWLGRTGRLSGPYTGSELVGHLQDRAGAVLDALRDRERWGPSKRLMVSLADSGVDLSDPDQLQAAMEVFNARSFGERDATLGPMPSGAGLFGQGSFSGRPGSTFGALVGPLPPVRLATEHELDAASRASIWWQRVHALCGYVGEGKRLTDNGNLKLADGRALVALLGTGEKVDPQIGGRVYKTRSTTQLGEVDLAFTLAVEALFLQRGGGRVVPHDPHVLDEAPREAAYRLLLALHQVGPVNYHFGEDRYGLGWYADGVDDALPMLLVDLYRAPATLTVTDVGDGFWRAAQHHLAQLGVAEQRWAVLRTGFDFGVGLALRRLMEFGVVEEDDAGLLRLTALGAWCVHRLVSPATDAPVLGALAACSGQELLLKAGDLPEPVAAAEIDHWLSLHGPDALVAALRSAGATGRALAFRALLRAGPAAADAVAALDEEPALAAYADVWRVDTLQRTPLPATDAKRLVRVLGAVLDVWGPQSLPHWTALLSEAPLPLVEQAWRLRLRETEAVLAALGGVGDKSLAKAARKSLFKLRSAG